MSVHAIFEQFETNLQQQLAELQRLARAAAPGGIGDWEQVVTHFGLPSQGRPERARAAGERKHTRGALPEEFEAVVGVLARQASDVLDQLEAGLAQVPGVGERLAELRAKVDALPREQRQAYEQESKPKTGKGGLGGIFANAAATAKLTPWANIKYDPQYVLACPSCGSSQRTRLRFDCEYCGSSLFGETS